VAHYCDPVVDSLMTQAIVSLDGSANLWRAAIERVELDAPAVFLYSPINVYGVSTRLGQVDIRPGAPWSRLWRWTATRAAPARDSARRDTARR
jgi:hypothetical protein